MANFDIDVESPFEMPEKEILNAKPAKLPYPQNYPKYRFYGNNIKRMIDVAIHWEENEMKEGVSIYNCQPYEKMFPWLE